MTSFSRTGLYQLLGFLFLAGGMIPLVEWISVQMSPDWADVDSTFELIIGLILFAAGLGLLVIWRWTVPFFRWFVILLLVTLITMFLLFTTGVLEWRPRQAAGALLFSGALLFTFFVQAIRALSSSGARATVRKSEPDPGSGVDVE